jgi:hypothetical protein
MVIHLGVLAKFLSGDPTKWLDFSVKILQHVIITR